MLMLPCGVPAGQAMPGWQARVQLPLPPCLPCQPLGHASYRNRSRIPCRLTWLGDAVLGAAVSDLLFTGLPPNATTEQLHNRRIVCLGAWA